MRFILLLVFLFGSLYSTAQPVDSTYIESVVMSSLGKPAKLDSLQTTLLADVAHDFSLSDTYYYNLSKARFLSGQLDLAFGLAQEGIALCDSNNHRMRSAKFYNLQASVYAYKQENEKAIETFKTSLAILEEAGDSYTAAQIQNNIANIFFGLSDYSSAYQYSKSAYDELKKVQDTVHLPGVAGVLAVSSLKLNRIDEANELANESLESSTRYQNPVGLIISNYSLGEISSDKDNYDEAVLHYEESLRLSELYRQSHFAMLNKIGLQSAFRGNGQFHRSIEIGEQALEETTKLNNENTLYAIHKQLGYAHNELGAFEKGFHHFSTAHEIYIASSGVENQKAINDILIKYDTEKKEKELAVSHLENAESQNQAYRRSQWIIVLGTILILLVVSYLFYSRLQKQRMRQMQKDQESKRIRAAVKAEEDERERISNELHDGMASAITGLKMKLEDLAQDNENSHLVPLVGQLENLHDETRRMSHNLMPLGLNKENWVDRLNTYCRENSSRHFKIQFSNNIGEAISLDPTISILLYRSVQELIHNAQKHANSPICFVQLARMKQDLVISVEDEGIGFDIENQKGQGLESMRQRLIEIGATLEIDSQADKGSLVSIYAPLV